MTLPDFARSRCLGHLSRVLFANGISREGIPSAHIPGEPHTYYLLPAPKAQDFKAAAKANDIETMRHLCGAPMDIGSISRVEVLWQ